jgi:hypothetical protein
MVNGKSFDHPLRKRLTGVGHGDSIALTRPWTSTEDNAMKSSSSPGRRLGKSLVNSIRRPIAPPGHPLTHAKPDDKARPAGRKVKHKPGRNSDLASSSDESDS